MADTDWISYWASRGVTIEPGSDRAEPGNGLIPPFSVERAAELGVDADDADVVAPEVTLAPAGAFSTARAEVAGNAPLGFDRDIRVDRDAHHDPPGGAFSTARVEEAEGVLAEDAGDPTLRQAVHDAAEGDGAPSDARDAARARAGIVSDATRGTRSGAETGARMTAAERTAAGALTPRAAGEVFRTPGDLDDKTDDDLAGIAQALGLNRLAPTSTRAEQIARIREARGATEAVDDAAELAREDARAEAADAADGGTFSSENRPQ